MDAWGSLYVIWGSIVFEESLVSLIPRSGRERSHLPMRPCAAYTLRCYSLGCLEGWQMRLFSAHVMPETFHVVIGNFSETGRVDKTV